MFPAIHFPDTEVGPVAAHFNIELTLVIDIAVINEHQACQA